MSAHLNVSGQVGGYNLENNTDPEFFNSVYNIFSKDAPESETESRHVDWLLPDRRIAEDTTVINYNMSKQKNKFTDLASIRIWGSVILEKKTKDENNQDKWGPTEETDRVSVINNVVQAQFGKIVFTINDTEITDPASDPYPWTSYMATLFNTTATFKKHLETELYVKDTSGTLAVTKDYPLEKYGWEIDPACLKVVKVAVPNPKTPGGNEWKDCSIGTRTVITSTPVRVNRKRKANFNEGFVKRRKLLIGRKESYPFVRRVDHDIVTALSVVPPQTRIGIKFYKKNQDFLILKDKTVHPNDEFRLRLVDLVVEVQLTKVKPKVATPYMSMLRNPSHVPNISFTRNFTKMYNVLGDNQLDFGAPFWINGGTLPDTMILAFVRQTAYLGNDSQNPYNFELIQFNDINLVVNTELYSPNRMNSNTERGRRQLYAMLQDSCGRNQQTGFILDITYEEFIGGYFFIYFDRTPSRDNRATKTSPEVGNLSIRLITDNDDKKNEFLKGKDNWVVLVHSVYPSSVKFYGEQAIVDQFV